MDYYEKYIKYKQKYLQLKGGNQPTEENIILCKKLHGNTSGFFYPVLLDYKIIISDDKSGCNIKITMSICKKTVDSIVNSVNDINVDDFEIIEKECEIHITLTENKKIDKITGFFQLYSKLTYIIFEHTDILYDAVSISLLCSLITEQNIKSFIQSTEEIKELTSKLNELNNIDTTVINSKVLNNIKIHINSINNSIINLYDSLGIVDESIIDELGNMCKLLTETIEYLNIQTNCDIEAIPNYINNLFENRLYTQQNTTSNIIVPIEQIIQCDINNITSIKTRINTLINNINEHINIHSNNIINNNNELQNKYTNLVSIKELKDVLIFNQNEELKKTNDDVIEKINNIKNKLKPKKRIYYINPLLQTDTIRDILEKYKIQNKETMLISGNICE